MGEQRFEADGRSVTVRQAGEGGPVVYLHVFAGDGRQEWDRCRKLGCDNFTLAAIGGLQWDDDMTPWYCPPLFKGDNPCHGKARQQLDLLLNGIKPQVERLLERTPDYSAIVGYSLGGLFAAWAAFQTDAFARMASASGSLWFPDFADYVKAHEVLPALAHAYFSLGDRESRTPNFYLKHVGEATEAVVAAFKTKGVDAVFESNRGNHFKDEDLRTAKGICWMLAQ